MRSKALGTFKCKFFFRPFRKFIAFFRFKLKKPVFIKALLHRPCHVKLKKTSRNINHKKSSPGKKLNKLRSIFHIFKKKKNKKPDMDMSINRTNEVQSVSDTVSDRKLVQSPLTPAKKLFTSPLTPPYLRAMKGSRKDILDDDPDVEEACRRFENYLVQMIVDEGKVEDLTDIEELLHCWRNLKNPIFIGLVSRFYGELCKDLFSTTDVHDHDAFYCPKMIKH